MRLIQPLIIIGGGNMGTALAIRWHTARIGAVHVVEPDVTRHRDLNNKGITCHARLQDAPKKSSVLALAIKPQMLPEMMGELHDAAMQSGSTLLLSVIAGIPLDTLKQISPNCARVMPNLPAMIGESMSVAFAPEIDTLGHKIVTHLFESIGKLAWVEDESLLHAATAISGSGPGYVFAFMEALERAAVAQGLTQELAHQLVRQTLRGAALLAEQSPSSVSTLRQNVTSPGGTTEAALGVFTQAGLGQIVIDAAAAAAARSKALAE